MIETGFVAPIVAAFGLLRRIASLVVWAAQFTMALAIRALVTEASARAIATRVFSKAGTDGLLILEALIPLVSALIGMLILLFFARTLIAPQATRARPLYARFLGLLIAYALIGRLIDSAGTAAIFLNHPSEFMRTYGSILVGSFSSIVTFPFAVRALAAAAGIEQPRLGGVVAFVFGEGRFAYIWYAICAVLFPVAMVYAFANLLGPGNQANELAGNLVQSAITSTGNLLQYLLAVVAARWTLPDGRRLAETFA